MHVSKETTHQTDARLRRVIAQAEFEILDGSFAFTEVELSDAGLAVDAAALAYVRDTEALSILKPSTDPTRELSRVFCFHFPSGVDNSGFLGWLATHLKARIGTGVFVVCGQNSARGGIFDYWGCPLSVADAVIAEVHKLRGNERPQPARREKATLNGIRMAAVTTASEGAVKKDTVFEFSETDSVVTATYAGGGIRSGCLAGVRTGHGLFFRYAQVDEGGRVDGGRSQCEVKRLDDGRYRIIEHFQWESRPGSGTNVLDEIK